MVLILVAFFQFFIMTPLIHKLAGFQGYHLNLAQHTIGSVDMTPLQTIAAYATGFLRNCFSTNASFVVLIIIMFNITLIKFPQGLILIIPMTMLFIATSSIHSHRHAILIAPLFITLIEGVARLPERQRKTYTIVGVVIPAIAVLLAAPHSILGTNLRELVRPDHRNVFHYRYTPHDSRADSLLRCIPAEAPVAADAPLRTKLVNREYAFINPSPRDSMRADYYLFDFFEKLEYDDAWPARSRVASLIRSGNFKLSTNLDGLVIVQKTPPRQTADDFNLISVDTIPPPPIPAGSCQITAYRIDIVDGCCISRMLFYKGTLDSTKKHAFISFFIDEKSNDTLRVLHLASYTLSRLEVIDSGWYDETFRFDIPPGTTIANRRHEVWLYAKEGYLPFFSRNEYRVKKLFATNG
jgi:hypothetical protein